MRTLKLTIAYDGTNYVGWQRQSEGVSIQQLVEDACAPLGPGPAPAVAGAGRTDSGVHAAGQVASLALETALSVDTLQRAINFRLPADVRVLRVEDAPEGFHARFDANGKSYAYRMVTAAVLSPFERWFAWHAPGRYDVPAMRSAAAVLAARHDFASFQAAGSDTVDTVRTIRRLEIVEQPGELRIEFDGDGFLRHMVRAIVGTLAEIGTGQRAADSMPAILHARDRRAAGRTVPACGLTLLRVHYDSEGKNCPR